MPPIIAALPAFGLQLIQGLLLSGISYGLQAALEPKARRPYLGGNINRLRSITRDSTGPLRIIYGLHRVSGVLIYSRSVDIEGVERTGGLFLHVCIPLAPGPIVDLPDAGGGR